MAEFDLKCISLKGELSDFGKHIMIPNGFTLCGLPTVDYDKKNFPMVDTPAMKDLVSEYTIEEWEITCPKCLEIITIIKKHRKNIN